MSLNATPDNLFPLATAAGVAIPLSVVRPKVHYPILSLVSEVAITLPQDINVCECTFEVDTYIYSGIWIAPANGVAFQDAYLCKAGMLYDLALPQNIKVRPKSGATNGHINVVETWVQLQNTNYGAS